jgi:coiled-coil and C2 domain-containing protein 1
MYSEVGTKNFRIVLLNFILFLTYKTRTNFKGFTCFFQALNAHRKGAAYDYSSLPEPPGESKLDNAQFTTTQSLNNRQSIISTVSSSSSLQPTPPKQSRQEEQLSFLLHRQAQFKEAALLAKKRGDMDAAKTYLRQAKGFDEMIEGSRCGLRVDISATPVPPQARTDDRALKPQMAATG